MTFDYLLDYRAEFACGGRIYDVGIIYSLHGFVRRNFEYVEPVNRPEFFLFGLCRTGHTGEFIVKSEIVLEGYGRVSLVFVSDDDVFFRLDCLMKTFGI